MRRFFIPYGIFACVFLFGCSHYQNALPLKTDPQSTVKGAIAVAGVLDCQVKDKKPFPCKDATERLVKDSGFPDHSAKITSDDLTLLLADPLTLSVYRQQLSDIRQRLGFRYALAGKQGAHAVSSYTIWQVIVVVPIPPVVAWFTIPVQVSEQHGFLGSERILRVVDLDQAKVVSESFTLLRDHDANGMLQSTDITEGISSMMLSKE